MITYYDPIVAEVRQIKANLLEKYGGMEGLLKHMDEERPRLEKEGWRFVSAEEAIARKKRARADTPQT